MAAGGGVPQVKDAMEEKLTVLHVLCMCVFSHTGVCEHP